MTKRTLWTWQASKEPSGKGAASASLESSRGIQWLYNHFCCFFLLRDHLWKHHRIWGEYSLDPPGSIPCEGNLTSSREQHTAFLIPQRFAWTAGELQVEFSQRQPSDMFSQYSHWRFYLKWLTKCFLRFLNCFISIDQSAKFSSNEFLLIAKSSLITVLII